MREAIRLVYIDIELAKISAAKSIHAKIQVLQCIFGSFDWNAMYALILPFMTSEHICKDSWLNVLTSSLWLHLVYALMLIKSFFCFIQLPMHLGETMLDRFPVQLLRPCALARICLLGQCFCMFLIHQFYAWHLKSLMVVPNIITLNMNTSVWCSTFHDKEASNL